MILRKNVKRFNNNWKICEFAIHTFLMLPYIQYLLFQNQKMQNLKKNHFFPLNTMFQLLIIRVQKL